MTSEYSKISFYEFFAGAGMARAGLGDGWKCLFANDFDRKKGTTYTQNWGADEIVVSDVRQISVEALPGTAEFVWGSFPCQDLSLAGGGAGLRGDRSGTFWPFWGIMKGLCDEGRAPSLIVLENVCGTLTSHQGKDFSAICSAFSELGYRYGAVVVDASLFLPQSRPRLFVIGVRDGVSLPGEVSANGPSKPWHTRALCNAYERLSAPAQQKWIWWSLASPPPRTVDFADLVEETPTDVAWHSPEETGKLLAMMSEVNLAKLETAKQAGRRVVGTIYKRTRKAPDGTKVQRAEVRFDDVAGCLRTPAGGSSRQLILVVDGNHVRSRLISARETARLMGLPDNYLLPEKYNEAYHLTGDGVVVPVVRHLAAHIFEPILRLDRHVNRVAA